MKDDQIFKDYLLVKEIGRDSFGKSFLAKKINKDKSEQKYIAVRLHDFIAGNSENHGLIKNYVKEIGKSSVPNILKPVDLIFDNDNILLIYPYIKGENLKTIIDNLERSSVELPFKTLVETVLRIAVIVDMGFMVTLNNQPSYHGLLIPENILIGYDGEIYLKYYGMLPFISSSSYSFIKENYKIWLAPELLLRDEVHYSSEIYYLGHIVYRILTGKYFPLEPGNFANAVTNISFNKTIPSTDTIFLSNLLEFFKNTLHPEVDQRIKSLDLFTSHISEKFYVSNTYSVKDSLSSLLEELFLPVVKEGDTVNVSGFLKENKDPAKTIARRRIDPDEFKGKIAVKKKSKALPVLLSIVVLCVIAMVTIFILDAKKKNLVNNLDKAIQVSTLEKKQESIPGAGPLQSVSGEKSTESEQSQTQKEEKDQSNGSIETDNEGSEQNPVKSKKGLVQPKSGKEIRSRTQNKNITSKQNPVTVISPQKKKEIYFLNELSEKPEKVQGMNPVLKYEMKKYHKNGPDQVLVNLLLDKKGRVGKIELMTEVNAKIGDIISEILFDWKFTPAIKDGQAVQVKMPVSVFIEFESIPLVQLSDLTGKPQKKTGKISFSREIRRNYIGRRRTVKINLLINHQGSVEQIEMQSFLPADLERDLKANIFKWVYTIPMKGNQKVKVWLKETLRIEIK